MLVDARDRLIEDEGGSTTDTRRRVMCYLPKQGPHLWPLWKSPWVPVEDPQVLAKLTELGIAFRDLHTDQSSLEEIFVSLVDGTP